MRCSAVESGDTADMYLKRVLTASVLSPEVWRSYLEGGDVQILPERQTQHVQVLAAITKRTGQRDEDCREEGTSRMSGSEI